MKHEQKKEIISKYARDKSDTGSPEVQIAILTVRIESLTDHLNTHKKDNHSRRGLLGLVQKRRKLKNYLQKNNPEAYSKIVDEVSAKKDSKKSDKAALSAVKAPVKKAKKATTEKESKPKKTTKKK